MYALPLIGPQISDDSSAFDYPFKKQKHQVIYAGELPELKQAKPPLNNELISHILSMVADDEETLPANLRLVCKKWRDLIDKNIPRDKEGKIDKDYIQYKKLSRVWQRIIQAASGGLKNKDFYDQFATGRVFLQDVEGKEGTVIFYLSDLNNPFNGTFIMPLSGYINVPIRFTTSLYYFVHCIYPLHKMGWTFILTHNHAVDYSKDDLVKRRVCLSNSDHGKVVIYYRHDAGFSRPQGLYAKLDPNPPTKYNFEELYKEAPPYEELNYISRYLSKVSISFGEE